MTTTSGPGEQDLGTLERGDGQVRLIFTRRFPHPPGKVWRALTEAEHLAAWFPTTIEGDLVAGATLRFAFRELNLPAFDGAMLSCVPPRMLEFVWGDEQLRFELTADGQATGTEFLGVLHRARPRGQGRRGLAHLPRPAGLRNGRRAAAVAPRRPLAGRSPRVRARPRPGGRDHWATRRMGRGLRPGELRSKRAERQDRRAAHAARRLVT